MRPLVRFGHVVRLSGIAMVIACAGALPAAAATNCSFTTVVGVVFGVYDVFGASPVDSNGTIVIKCTGNPSLWTLTLSMGNAPTYTPRYMIKTAEQLTYNLYLDAGRTQIWGDGTGGTVLASGSGNGFSTFTVYGRLPAGVDVTGGAYSDTIVATINF